MHSAGGYSLLGSLKEYPILDPNDDRDAAAKAAHPHYAPFLDCGTVFSYVDFFVRMSVENASGTKSRPSLEAVIDAEVHTEDWAFRLVRSSHLEGRAISVSQGLEQAMRDCSVY